MFCNGCSNLLTGIDQRLWPWLCWFWSNAYVQIFSNPRPCNQSLIWKSLPTAAVWINWDTIVLVKWVLNAAAKRTSCSVLGPGGRASLQASGRLTCRTSMTESHTPEGGKTMFKLKQVTHRERNIHNHSYLSVSRLECGKQNDIRHQTKQKKDKKFSKSSSLQSYGRSKNISIQVSRKCFLQHKLRI